MGAPWALRFEWEGEGVGEQKGGEVCRCGISPRGLVSRRRKTEWVMSSSSHVQIPCSDVLVCRLGSFY